MQLYTTEQSLQSVHRSQLEHRLARVDVKQRTTRASRPVPSRPTAGQLSSSTKPLSTESKSQVEPRIDFCTQAGSKTRSADSCSTSRRPSRLSLPPDALLPSQRRRPPCCPTRTRTRPLLPPLLLLPRSSQGSSNPMRTSTSGTSQRLTLKSRPPTSTSSNVSPSPSPSPSPFLRCRPDGHAIRRTERKNKQQN